MTHFVQVRLKRPLQTLGSCWISAEWAFGLGGAVSSIAVGLQTPGNGLHETNAIISVIGKRPAVRGLISA